MRINSVCAKNFRTLEDFRIEFDPHYCAISGRNNAGKSAILYIISHFLSDHDDFLFRTAFNRISFSRDATQWSDAKEMVIELDLTIEKDGDAELFYFIERFSENKLDGSVATITLREEFTAEISGPPTCYVNGIQLKLQDSSEVLKKLKSSANLSIHNSTNPNPQIYYRGSDYTEILETNFSADDRQRISDAQTRLQNAVKKAAKQHKEELDRLLGLLSDKYQVELSSVAGGRASRFPLEVKLTDRRVHVALRDWGAGTQNRTRILISVLEAIRTRDSASAENRNTPVFIVEEPESFLHPSAQAEFGQVLNSLANNLDVQILATTHSPYMLN